MPLPKNQRCRLFYILLILGLIVSCSENKDSPILPVIPSYAQFIDGLDLQVRHAHADENGNIFFDGLAFVSESIVHDSIPVSVIGQLDVGLNVVWLHYFDDRAVSIANSKVVDGQELLFTGNSWIPGDTSGAGIWTSATNTSGVTIWEQLQSFPFCCEAGYDVIANRNGEYVLCGLQHTDDSIYSSQDIFVGKLDQNGEVLWAQTFVEQPTSEYGIQIVELEGPTESYALLARTSNGMNVMLIDANGQAIEVYELPGKASGASRSFAVSGTPILMSDGDIVFCRTDLPDNAAEVFRVDPTGGLEWVKLLGKERIVRMVRKSDSELIALGWSRIGDHITEVETFIRLMDEQGTTNVKVAVDLGDNMRPAELVKINEDRFLILGNVFGEEYQNHPVVGVFINGQGVPIE